ncbi:terpene synthase family protein [Ktedonobacter robiniae]|uniref:Terpene synthase n=1 Tax=Ktedonobacter robiniae TaxID=2778365 RepID=A0ABQ3URQ5_9CHLR|nr:hypothetical protein [Ktedonobacter robiniae]GHO55404.1 hypothetical protein KSB_38790 [Ktedonobacter robiniae]
MPQYKLMEHIHIPPLYCPFEPRVSPHVQIVQDHTQGWVQHFRLLKDEATRHFAAVRMGWLVARCYPTATVGELLLLADWLTWLFIVDDLFSEGAMSQHPKQMQFIMNEFIVTLYGITKNFKKPLTEALHDLWSRTTQEATTSWQARFKRHLVANYFAGTCWEADNRAQGHVPDVDTYIENRRSSSGMLMGIDFIDFVERISFPSTLRLSDAFQTILRMTNNIVCWANDIVSLRKEIEHHDVNNLVLVLQHTYQLPLQDAVNITSEMIERETKDFLLAEQRLITHFPLFEEQLQRYTAALRALIRGNLDWSLETARYLQKESTVGK